jgi:hypothetical protein
VNRPGRARRVAVDEQLANRHLPGWDYVDAYTTMLPPGAPRDPAKLSRIFLCAGTGAQSRLLRQLLRGRDRLARLVGLKPAARPPGELLPIITLAHDLIVMGLNDRHLDFRLLLSRHDDHVVVTTLVKRHNALGTAYFIFVRPAHQALVPRLLDSATSRDWKPAPCAPRVPGVPTQQEPR